MSIEKATLTTQETADLLGVTRAALYKMMDRGELSPLPQETEVQFPRLQFDKKQVQALKQQRQREGRDKPRRSRTPRKNAEPREHVLV